MSIFHKIVENGEKTYRRVNESTGYYEDEVLTGEEVIEELLDESVEEFIEIDKGQIERSIHQREIVQNYIDYLERLVDSLE